MFYISLVHVLYIYSIILMKNTIDNTKLSNKILLFFKIEIDNFRTF